VLKRTQSILYEPKLLQNWSWFREYIRSVVTHCIDIENREDTWWITSYISVTLPRILSILKTVSFPSAPPSYPPLFPPFASGGGGSACTPCRSVSIFGFEDRCLLQCQICLRFVHINIGSFVTCVALVRDVIAFHCLNVLAGGETWLQNSIDSGSVDIDNYVFVRLDRSKPPWEQCHAIYRWVCLSNSPRSAWASRRWVLTIVVVSLHLARGRVAVIYSHSRKSRLRAPVYKDYILCRSQIKIKCAIKGCINYYRIMNNLPMKYFSFLKDEAVCIKCVKSVLAMRNLW